MFNSSSQSGRQRTQNTTKFPINYHTNLPCLRLYRRRQTSLALKAHRAFNPKQARRSEVPSRAKSKRSSKSSRCARVSSQQFSDSRAVSVLREGLILLVLRHWCSRSAALGSLNHVLQTRVQSSRCISVSCRYILSRLTELVTVLSLRLSPRIFINLALHTFWPITQEKVVCATKKNRGRCALALPPPKTLRFSSISNFIFHISNCQ